MNFNANPAAVCSQALSPIASDPQTKLYLRTMSYNFLFTITSIVLGILTIKGTIPTIPAAVITIAFPILSTAVIAGIVANAKNFSKEAKREAIREVVKHGLFLLFIFSIIGGLSLAGQLSVKQNGLALALTPALITISKFIMFSCCAPCMACCCPSVLPRPVQHAIQPARQLVRQSFQMGGQLAQGGNNGAQMLQGLQALQGLQQAMQQGQGGEQAAQQMMQQLQQALEGGGGEQMMQQFQEALQQGQIPAEMMPFLQAFGMPQ